MLTIKVRPSVSRAEFEGLAKSWDAAKNASLEVGVPVSEDGLRNFSNFLLGLSRFALARSVLAELCEKPSMPQDILERVFLDGGTACRVAICLRSDLSETLVNMCERCDEEVVVEHFRQSRGDRSGVV